MNWCQLGRIWAVNLDGDRPTTQLSPGITIGETESGAWAYQYHRPEPPLVVLGGQRATLPEAAAAALHHAFDVFDPESHVALRELLARPCPSPPRTARVAAPRRALHA